MVIDNGNIIIVFDGYCVLCDNFVKWIAKKDKYNKIHFTTFESDYINKNYSCFSRFSRNLLLIFASLQADRLNVDIRHHVNTWEIRHF